MGTFHSIGKVLCNDLENVDFSNIKLMANIGPTKPKYKNFMDEALNDQNFWNQLGMRKTISNSIKPKIVVMDMDDDLLTRLKQEIKRAKEFDRQVFEIENSINRELNVTGERISNYRTFDVQINAALMFCPSLLELAIRNFANTDLLIGADSVTVEKGYNPLGIHNAFNALVMDNFYGKTECPSPTNYHLNLNTSSNYENQSPFVLWLGMDEEIRCPRYTAKYLLEKGILNDQNKSVLLDNLFVAENCWEAIMDTTLTKSAVYQILDPLFYKARYCLGDSDISPEGVYAVTAPNEALVFSSCIAHSSNYFPPASEQRISAIIRTTKRTDLNDDNFILSLAPGSNNSGVAIKDRFYIAKQEEEKINSVYSNFFGYKVDTQSIAHVEMWNPKSIEKLKNHYEMASSFFAQDRFILSNQSKQAIRNFFIDKSKKSS